MRKKKKEKRFHERKNPQIQIRQIQWNVLKNV